MRIASAHTPGPWYVTNGYIRQDSDAAVIAVVTEGWKVYCSSLAQRDTGEADARLIAAAPDLLAALQSAVATIKAFHGAPAWEIYVANAPEMQTIRAAIAKAEGWDWMIGEKT